MRYHATDLATPDRMVAADRARRLRSRPPVSIAALDLLDQLAEFWEHDDLRALEQADALTDDDWPLFDDD